MSSPFERRPPSEGPPPSANGDWYADAELYDFAFGEDAEREARMLRQLFEHCGVAPDARLLEPMCGTGRLLVPLAEDPYELVGFDLAPAMVARARKRVPRAHLFRADAGRFRLAPSFDAAFCLIDSFRYLLGDEAVTGFFNGVADSLRPGAPFVLGFDVAGSEDPPDDRWTVRDEARSVTTTVRSGGDAGPGRQWMRVRLELEQDGQSNVHESRRPQRIWNTEAFEELIASQSAFERAGLWLRTNDLGSPLEAPPRAGASVVLLLIKR